MHEQGYLYDAGAIRDLLVVALSDEELNELCFDSFRSVHDTFSAGQTRTAKIQLLVEYCDRHNEIPHLLALIKQYNPAKYWEFMATQAHQAIDLPAEPISSAQINHATLRQEYQTIRRETISVSEAQIEAFEDFQFWDRLNFPSQILENKANHIELYGPGGVGKTYILRYLTRGDAGTRAVYIDLNEHNTIETIWSEVVRQLRGEKTPPSIATFREVAKAIKALHSPQTGQPVNRFLFLFDSASEAHRTTIDWLVSSEGLINNEPFRRMLRALGVSESEVKLQVVIAARRPVLPYILKVDSYHPNFRLAQIGINPLKKELVLENDAIYKMLEELVDYRGFPPLDLAHCREIIDKIYYLTVGHPKCAKLLLLGVAEVDFIPTPADWRRFFETRVLPTIQQEMFGTAIDPELLPLFWTLSVFRRFDQRLLGALLERRLLPGNPGSDLDITRQARQLRISLVDTYLVNEPGKGESMYTMDFTTRRVLSLGMQYRFSERFRALNSLALEIFTDWLQDPRTNPGRSIMCLIEIVYHWFKALEMDPNVKARAICGRIQTALQNYLPLLTTTIDKAAWPNYLPQLRACWEEDVELQETAYQATGGAECYDRLLRQIRDFVKECLNK